nr:hypothetical protein Iba_chr03aCG3930 [Ipomoea batatas]GMC71751.1 hypothetical protein Iba_chr03bCG5490 [Ipomoea batatas]
MYITYDFSHFSPLSLRLSPLDLASQLLFSEF